MSGTLIIPPARIEALVVSSGSGRDNLLTPSPREIWLAGDADEQFILVDLGADTLVDSFFLGSTNASAEAVWTIATATAAGEAVSVIKAAGPCRSADAYAPYHCFHRLADPVTARWLRIAVEPSSSALLYVGNIVVGLAFEQFREFGSGRTPIDTGTRNGQSDGGFGASGGVTKALFNWSFIDLSQAEVHQLWGIVRRLGLRRPCVVVEDADLDVGQNEAIHYGVFEKFQPYERRDVGETYWSFSHEEWR